MSEQTKNIYTLSDFFEDLSRLEREIVSAQTIAAETVGMQKVELVKLPPEKKIELHVNSENPGQVEVLIDVDFPYAIRLNGKVIAEAKKNVYMRKDCKGDVQVGEYQHAAYREYDLNDLKKVYETMISLLSLGVRVVDDANDP